MGDFGKKYITRFSDSNLALDDTFSVSFWFKLPDIPLGKKVHIFRIGESTPDEDLSKSQYFEITHSNGHADMTDSYFYLLVGETATKSDSKGIVPNLFQEGYMHNRWIFAYGGYQQYSS